MTVIAPRRSHKPLTPQINCGRRNCKHLRDLNAARDSGIDDCGRHGCDNMPLSCASTTRVVGGADDTKAMTR
jgi:hypothetical protein